MTHKVKFITSIYSDLSGTEFGGRSSRSGHYKYSLLSLLKMTDADFLCYTSDREINELERFFYETHSISKDKLKFEIYDISNTKFKDLINEFKDVEATKNSDRCVEIQYSKFHWWWNEDKSYDYYYWIDAGLSHCGLVPVKYLSGNHPERKYYECSLFNNDFLKNMVEDTNGKFLIIGKDNVRNYWSGTIDPKWYNEYDQSIHIIGGLFGGHKNTWDKIVTLFEDYLQKITIDSQKIYHEELFMSLMYFNHKELFERKHFDIWWCRDNAPSDAKDELFIENKSFYKILNEFNRIDE